MMNGLSIDNPVPIGIGTWGLGMFKETRSEGIVAIRQAVDAGFMLVDTAEAYGDGYVEAMIGDALRGADQSVYIVTKVLPQNVKNGKIRQSCENSLRRLRREVIDCYLLHEPGDVPVGLVVEEFARLSEAGLIRSWGVSNADLFYLAAVETASSPDNRLACNQVLFNLKRRRAELDILPFCKKRNITVQAYSPLEQNRPFVCPSLLKVATAYGVAPQQIALAWVIAKGVTPIVKASSIAHILANRRAADIALPPDVLRCLDRDYPLPTRSAPFERYDRVHAAPS